MLNKKNFLLVAVLLVGILAGYFLAQKGPITQEDNSTTGTAKVGSEKTSDGSFSNHVPSKKPSETMIRNDENKAENVGENQEVDSEEKPEVAKVKSEKVEKLKKESEQFKEARDSETLEFFSKEIRPGMERWEVIEILGKPSILLAEYSIAYSSKISKVKKKGKKEEELGQMVLQIEFADAKGLDSDVVSKVLYGTSEEIYGM